MQKVHLWIGQMDGDKHEFYFIDQPPEDEHGFLHNEFARDQNELSIDYDFTEISFLDDRKDVREFVSGHSYSESYLDVLVDRANQLGLEQVNVFVLANSDEFSNPTSIERDGLRLEYLGLFDCDD